MTVPEIKLTAFETLQFLWNIPQIIFKAIFSIIYALAHDRTLRRLKRTIVTSILHSQSSVITFRQARAVQIPTAVAITKFCNSRKLAHATVHVPIPQSSKQGSKIHQEIPSAVLHLISTSLENRPPSASASNSDQRTLFYLHGGGYAHPVKEKGQLELALECAIIAKAPTLAVLEYELAPSLHHPGQLVQSLAALRVLLEDLDKSPQDIFLMGDSAGGNATLGVLAALKEGEGPQGWWPFANTMRFSKKSGAFLGSAVVLSPWCSLDTSRKSYAENEKWDFINPRKVHDFVQAWKPIEGEVWCDFLGAAGKDPGRWGQGFWHSVAAGDERVVEKTLMTVGSRECFLDEVTAMAKLMGASAQGEEPVRFVTCVGEVHVSAAIDVALRIRDGEMFSATMAFLQS
ncbi:alpha/beta-hydrolase [Corynespora cassiicola Philippines]|uniref:Alpha/beta-hydrolase n=1 Tax=Corynespora cassiicola Philippines TaxID=1448308 RepID=A0A2T2PB93_CORCC|nr:alpha/beta-hydrolase [Corynespora cassiicola Philippines]